MIYKLTFEDGRIDWCTAKDQAHLLKSYDDEFGLSLRSIKSLEEVSEEEAEKTMVDNGQPALRRQDLEIGLPDKALKLIAKCS